MKFKFLFLKVVAFAFISLTACAEIEGEKICGVWISESEYGKMTIEITPWKGMFYGYLLEHQSPDGKITKGAKEEEHILLTDLVFENDFYQNGKIFLDKNSDKPCGISFQFLNDNNLKVNYKCADFETEEVWVRKGFDKLKTEPQTSNNQAVAVENAETKPKKKTTLSGKNPSVVSPASAKNEVKNSASKSTESKDKKESQLADPPTIKRESFNVIGFSKTVDYDKIKATEKAVEALWTKIYNDDFSGQLNNISDQENMYAVYSNYDQPKGKMTITIGYKVADLKNVPSELTGTFVSANDYYSTPISGNASDYEGEGWEQIEQLMAYRNPKSADFEIYKFDSNYEVTEARLWIAAK